MVIVLSHSSNRCRYKEIDQKQKQIDDVKLENQQTEHDVKKKRKEAADTDHRLRRMAAEHPWISKDRAHFGQPNTDYDFTRNDPNEVAKKVTELSAQKEKMSKTVNARAHTQANHVSKERNFQFISPPIHGSCLVPLASNVVDHYCC